MAQVAIVNLQHAHVTVGLQAGGELSRGAALSGELGATYHFGDRPGFDVHSGANAIVYLFPFSVRAQWLQQEYALDFGARYAYETNEGLAFTYGTASECIQIEGRPLRTSTGVAHFDARARSRGDFALPRTPTCDEAFAAGLEWQRAAQYECASVPAFLQLAAELLAHDAPDALVAAALAAAEDEIAHARISSDLASRFLGTHVFPTLPEVPARPPLAGRAGLIRLATESWLDGCLAEGMASARARRASHLAVDRGARTAQRVIARDEARHAELGWDILEWAMEMGGEDALDAVSALRDTEMDAARHDHTASAHYGCLGASDVEEVTERHTAKSRRRLDALL
jgi:hypothetical protein